MDEEPGGRGELRWAVLGSLCQAADEVKKRGEKKDDQRNMTGGIIMAGNDSFR